MNPKKIIKIELSNPRFTRAELRDHASEFIHYAGYAGYVLAGFNKHLSQAKIYPLKPEIAERNHRLILETTLINARIIYQITQIYPSFKNWRIKSLVAGVSLAPPSRKKPATAPSSAKKPVKKVKKTVKKKATVKKAAKKTVKKETAKKAVTKKTVKKSPVKKVKTVKKKAAVKKAVKKTVKKKTAKKKR